MNAKILPSEAEMLVSSRARVVWTKDERRLLDRLSKIFNRHGDKLQLRCGNTTCPAPELTIHRDSRSEGGAVLRCGCRDRVFSQVH